MIMILIITGKPVTLCTIHHFSALLTLTVLSMGQHLQLISPAHVSLLNSRVVCSFTYISMWMSHRHLMLPPPKMNSWSFLLNCSPSEQKVPASTHLLETQKPKSHFWYLPFISFILYIESISRYCILFFFYHPCHHSMSSHVIFLLFYLFSSKTNTLSTSTLALFRLFYFLKRFIMENFNNIQS